jgi:regulatory protein
MGEPPSTPCVIEAIRGGSGRMRLLRLSDGRELLITAEACERAGLVVGAVAGEGFLERLDGEEQRVQAHDAALALLGRKARSETEMRQRLRMRGIDPDAIDDEIARLRSAGLLNDRQFAQAWVEDRKRLAPRGRRMLRYELLGRGIAPEAVDEATDGIDDLATARELARARARGSALADYDTFMTKVGGFLRRRGFSYDVVSTAARDTWAELGGRPADDGQWTEDAAGSRG